MSKTWLIFENGNHYSVDCTLHKAPKGHPKPVDAYLVTEHEGDFTIAARKAVYVVYEYVKRTGLDMEPVVAGFDLSERISLDSGLAGQSGGLSFAVSFAGKMLNQDPGNVAATGVIEAGGKIGAVKGIENKLKAAAELVKDGGMILFPKKNLNDLPETLTADLDLQNIKWIPVDDIGEVFNILFDLKPAGNGLSLKKTVQIILILILCCSIAAGAWFWGRGSEDIDQKNDQSSPEPVHMIRSEKETVLPSEPALGKEIEPQKKEVINNKPLPIPQPETTNPQTKKEEPETRPLDDKGFD